MDEGLLLEFPSVVAAVEFAIATQTEIAGRSQGIPESEAIRFRIGVHVGDGLNIKPRIEPLGNPTASACRTMRICRSAPSCRYLG